MKCKRCNNKAIKNKTLCIECAQRQKETTDKCRQKKKLLGICTHCSNKASDGYAVCNPCLQKSHDRTLSKKQSGLCLDCNKKCDSTYCKNCSFARSEVKSSKRHEKRKSGICTNCNNIAESGFKTCADCLNATREQRQLLIDSGICVTCGKAPASKGLKRCASCHVYDTERRALFKSKNKCLCCGKERGHGSYCEKCYLKLRAKAHLGSRKLWTSLKDIFNKQGGKCPYTGENLLLGHNTELDHIISKSNGGKNEPDNLQWTLSIINKMKSSNNDKTFLEIIKQIYEYRSL